MMTEQGRIETTSWSSCYSPRSPSLLFIYFYLIGFLCLREQQQGGAFACEILNECGRLGEKEYSGTSIANPEVIVFKDYNLSFANGLRTKGRKLSFVPDINPNSSYSGIWRVKKGTQLFVKLRNLHPSEGVNLHTHGLHVKGTGHDDPAIEIPSGSEHLYQLPISRNHAGGTLWMHPHYHGHGVANIEGGALGMLIVEDDELDREVPNAVRTAETFHLIFQYHVPARWSPPITTAKNFFTVNGLTNNPVLRLRRGKWLRLRMLSTSISFGKIFSTQWTVPFGATCNVVLIAKDGVYLKTSRRMQSPFVMKWTEASRADVMVKCDGDAGLEIQVVFEMLKVFRIKLTDRSANETPDDFDIHFKPCLPEYLNLDLSKETPVNVFPVQLDALMRFQGFGQDKAIGTFMVGSTIDLNLVGFGHPFHIHINHFQIQHEAMDGWYQPGDWHDTAQDVRARMRLDRWTQLMLVHCHNIVHQEESNREGMAAVIWINGTDGQDAPFGDSCAPKVLLLPTTKSPTTGKPSVSPTTSFPSRAPVTSFPSKRPTTSRPSKSPSINIKCLGYSEEICPSPRCYYHSPDPELVKQALAKVPKTKKKGCLKELGCRAATPPKLFCKYKCLSLCALDPNCQIKKVRKVKKCIPFIQ